jgi:hypothetical protein
MRMTHRLIRLVLCAGVLACSAAFVDVARAGLPSTPAAPVAATATQSAVPTLAAAVPETPAAPAASPLPVTPAPVPAVQANTAPAVQTAPVAAAQSSADSTTMAVTATVTSTVERTTTVATQAAAAVVTRAVETGVSTIGTTTTNATSVLGVTTRPASDLAKRIAPSSSQPTSAGTPALSSGTRASATRTPTTTAAKSGSGASGRELVSRAPSRNFRTVAPPARPGRLSFSSTAPRLFNNHRAATDRSTRSPVPLPRLPWPSPVGVGAAVGAAGGSGPLLFGLLAFAFLLAIPNAVRWLRSALALGLSPAYVALSDRPG